MTKAISQLPSYREEYFSVLRPVVFKDIKKIQIQKIAQKSFWILGALFLATAIISKPFVPINLYNTFVFSAIGMCLIGKMSESTDNQLYRIEKPSLDKCPQIQNQCRERRLDYSIYHLAAEVGDSDLLEILSTIKNMQTIFHGPNTPLMLALQNGQQQAFKVLLKKSFLFPREIKEMITIAIKTGKFSFVQVLKQQAPFGYLVENKRFTVLHQAAIDGDIEVMRRCVNELKIPITAEMSLWRRPIHLAAAAGKTEAVLECLRLKEKVQVFDAFWTPMHIAAAFNQPAVIEALTRAGGNVDIRSDYYKGFTPLQVAVSLSSTDAVEKLLELEADVERKDDDCFSLFSYIYKSPNDAFALNPYRDQMIFPIYQKNRIFREPAFQIKTPEVKRNILQSLLSSVQMYRAIKKGTFTREQILGIIPDGQEYDSHRAMVNAVFDECCRNTGSLKEICAKRARQLDLPYQEKQLPEEVNEYIGETFPRRIQTVCLESVKYLP